MRRALRWVARVESSDPQVPLEFGDPAENPSAVRLELCFSRTPGPDSAGLPAQPGALAVQSGEVVPQQGQLDLQHSFPAGGVLGEDIEDQGFSIDDVALEDLLEVALLGGSQGVVEHNHIDVQRLRSPRPVRSPCRAR